MNNPELIRKNIQTIQQQIEITLPDDRKASDIHLVAVTKTVTPDVMRTLFQNGIHDFGENRSNVLIEKQTALADLEDEVIWHFIGRLQSRQVKTIINQIDYLHSLDRLSLAKEIQKRAVAPVKCFIQVNISGEESKAGFSPDQLDDMIQALAQYNKIQIVGLMTMAPYDAPETELEQQFRTLKALQMDIMNQQHSHAPCTQVSMGMSRDFPIALQEGATFIRIGSAFFQGLELE